jgi:stearoyl-CoA desaturase (delta-9 desaturase)
MKDDNFWGRTQGMTRVHKISNLVGVVLPFVAFVAAVVLLWNELVDWSDLAVLAIMYVLTGFGVTLGFHRLLTHRSFQTFKPVEYLLASLGSMAVQGPVMTWVADHRKHHAHTDQEGDPHSPHGHGGGLKGALHGLYHAHMGWLFDRAGMAAPERYAKDLHEDRGMHVVQKAFLPLVLAGFVLPFLLGWAIGGTLADGLTGALWGGFVRIFLLHHVTWSINSVCHFFGTRRFAVDDHSTNVFWLSLLSFGESWHHNHHAFPRSAVHGLKRWELDPTAWVIRAMKRLKLAWNVVEITPERQAQKLAT